MDALGSMWRQVKRRDNHVKKISTNIEFFSQYFWYIQNHERHPASHSSTTSIALTYSGRSTKNRTSARRTRKSYHSGTSLPSLRKPNILFYQRGAPGAPLSHGKPQKALWFFIIRGCCLQAAWCAKLIVPFLVWGNVERCRVNVIILAIQDRKNARSSQRNGYQHLTSG